MTHWWYFFYHSYGKTTAVSKVHCWSSSMVYNEWNWIIFFIYIVAKWSLRKLCSYEIMGRVCTLYKHTWLLSMIWKKQGFMWELCRVEVIILVCLHCAFIPISIPTQYISIHVIAGIITKTMRLYVFSLYSLSIVFTFHLL